MNDRPLFASAHSRARPSAWRIGLAFLLMPPVSALAAAAIFSILSPAGGGTDTWAPFALMGGLASVVVVLVGALPAFLTLKRRAPITLRQTLWAGAALGNVPGALVAIFAALFALAHLAAGTISQHLSPLPALLASTVALLVAGSAVGTISAAVFWFVAVRGTDLAA